MLVILALGAIGAIGYVIYLLGGLVVDGWKDILALIANLAASCGIGTLFYWLGFGKDGWRIQKTGNNKMLLPIAVSTVIAWLYLSMLVGWVQGLVAGEAFDVTTLVILLVGAGLYLLWFIIMRRRVATWKLILAGQRPEPKPIKVKAKRNTTPMGWHYALVYGLLYFAAAVSLYAGALLIAGKFGVNIGFWFIGEEIGALIAACSAEPTANMLCMIFGIVMVVYAVYLAIISLLLLKHKSIGPKLLTVAELVAIILPLGFFFTIYGLTKFDAIPYTTALVVVVLLVMNREYYGKRFKLFEN